MRPVLTGLMAGISANILVFLVLWNFKVLATIFNRFGAIDNFFGWVVLGGIGGILYGLIYRRAANDRQGGWIFGASTGFIFWMINPVTWWPWFEQKPIFVGYEAAAFLVSHVLFGFFLGLLFPLVNKFSSKPLEKLKNENRVPLGGAVKRFRYDTI
jgi:hypothetical protein